MKIELSKEHIEKGCELVEDYQTLRGYLHYVKEGKGFYAIIDKDSPEYRDFLQLVIEAIDVNCDINIMSSFYQETKTWTIYIESNNHNWCIDEIKTITEAKEKAIAYVFDNMGA